MGNFYVNFAGENLQPSGGDAERLCSVFGRKDALGEIKDILIDQDYVFELDRHEALTNALELPAASVGFGFSYLEAGDTPQGIDPASLIRTP